MAYILEKQDIRYILYHFGNNDNTNKKTIDSKSEIRNALISFNTNEWTTYECTIGHLIDTLENINNDEYFEIYTNLIHPINISKQKLMIFIKKNIIIFNVKYEYKFYDKKNIIDI